jgi:hypothetical protein
MTSSDFYRFTLKLKFSRKYREWHQAPWFVAFEALEWIIYHSHIIGTADNVRKVSKLDFVVLTVPTILAKNIASIKKNMVRLDLPV